ncbi:hypothetical protein K503DRAFT_804146 [Rhizopogon vinicolor AM-OR11-026]|uniref:Uncharacterized protein n=1 Tax=Rhizopogon vinicolor AM-OR11-026 TaxID=1314800 RepID=A0A1B7MM75_9AGAM|nr:hypothetical protein K503DRAFT_804146 [Rhizopogon vinicolor AM-OR11-026]
MSASQLLRQAIQNSTVIDSEVESILPHVVPLNEVQSLPPLLKQLRRPSRMTKLQSSYPPRHRHTQYYGFWITQQWLIDLGKNIQHPNDHLYPPYIDEYFMRGFDHIQWAVGINPLTVEICLQLKKGGAPPEYVDADGDVLILSVMSDDEQDYPIRPAQEQVDYLTKVLDREPHWWVGVWPRSSWERM